MHIYNLFPSIYTRISKNYLHFHCGLRGYICRCNVAAEKKCWRLKYKKKMGKIFFFYVRIMCIKSINRLCSPEKLYILYGHEKKSIDPFLSKYIPRKPFTVWRHKKWFQNFLLKPINEEIDSKFLVDSISFQIFNNEDIKV